MRPILIGAGRGSRLEHETDEIPKPLVPVMGRPMLDWVLEALAEAGFRRRDVVFVCGYQKDVIQSRYPEFSYVENPEWERNNILASLLYAREHFGGGFVSSYTDIIYRGDVVKKLVASKAERVLAVDTDWRRRYVDRSRHPETDAEKIRAEGDRVVELSRHIPGDEAAGEFIGVAKLEADAARELAERYDRAARELGDEGVLVDRPFKRAYLIEMFQKQVTEGVDFRRVDTHGGYMEIDTLEDLSCAAKWWAG